MLHNTTGFELGGHEAKIAAAVDESSIHEELVRCSPEIVGIPLSKIVHLDCAFCGIGVSRACRTSNYELNLVVELVDDGFSRFTNEVHALLLRHSAHESEDWNRVIEISKVEVLLLKLTLSIQVVNGNSV